MSPITTHSQPATLSLTLSVVFGSPSFCAGIRCLFVLALDARGLLKSRECMSSNKNCFLTAIRPFAAIPMQSILSHLHEQNSSVRNI